GTLLAEGSHHEVHRRLERRREAYLAGVGVALARLERLRRYRHVEGDENGRRVEGEVGTAIELVARRRELAEIGMPLEGRAEDLDVVAPRAARHISVAQITALCRLDRVAGEGGDSRRRPAGGALRGLPLRRVVEVDRQILRGLVTQDGPAAEHIVIIDALDESHSRNGHRRTVHDRGHPAADASLVDIPAVV